MLRFTCVFFSFVRSRSFSICDVVSLKFFFLCVCMCSILFGKVDILFCYWLKIEKSRIECAFARALHINERNTQRYDTNFWQCAVVLGAQLH